MSIPAQDLPSSLAKTEANTTCIMTYCTDAALACVKDQACRTALSCLSTCDSLEDDSPDKIELQKCTADCVVTYENEALDAVNGCFDSHDCIALTPIPLACRDTHPAFPTPQNVTDMEGAWWATWGKNAVYDCYPCQRLSFSPLNASSWLYTSKYLTPTLEGGVRAYELQAAFPWPADGMATAIAFNYTYQGREESEARRVVSDILPPLGNRSLCARLRPLFPLPIPLLDRIFYVFFSSCLLLSGPFGPTPSACSLFASVVCPRNEPRRGVAVPTRGPIPCCSLLLRARQHMAVRGRAGLVARTKQPPRPRLLGRRGKSLLSFLGWRSLSWSVHAL